MYLTQAIQRFDCRYLILGKELSVLLKRSVRVTTINQHHCFRNMCTCQNEDLHRESVSWWRCGSQDLEEASIVLDKPHDSAESGTNSRRSSVRKSIPLSISLPDLTTLSSTKNEQKSEPAPATPRRGSIAVALSRSESMARMSSVKDAARDSAMESALRNFEARIAADNGQSLGRGLSSAPSNWAYALPAEIEVRFATRL